MSIFNVHFTFTWFFAHIIFFQNLFGLLPNVPTKKKKNQICTCPPNPFTNFPKWAGIEDKVDEEYVVLVFRILWDTVWLK